MMASGSAWGSPIMACARHKCACAMARLCSLRRQTLLLLALPLILATTASAFPSWIGVYGSYERHNAVNPGAFSVLLNEDYWGLHAEVVIRVDAGSWQAYEMNYVGNVDGNSVWTRSHDAAFPTNATVEYYFHGWDDWGGNITDNNGGVWGRGKCLQKCSEFCGAK